MKHKAPWEVWFWLALGSALTLITIAHLALQHWDRAMDSSLLAGLDFYIAVLIRSVSKAEHKNRLLLSALGWDVR